MKKSLVLRTLSLLLAVFSAVSLAACCNGGTEPDQTTAEETKALPESRIVEYFNVDSSEIIYTATTTEELDRLPEELRGNSNLEPVKWLLNKDIDNLASGVDGLTADDFHRLGLDTVEFDRFEVTSYNTDGNYVKTIFYFNVVKSSDPVLPVGEYYYDLSDLCWKCVSRFSVPEKYSEIETVIRYLSGHGAIAWENGAPTANESSFSFALFRTLDMYCRENGIELTDENLKKAAKTMFGIDNYVPKYIGTDGAEKDGAFEIKDGIWTEDYTRTCLAILNSQYEITDLRDGNGSIEVDLQYYSDTHNMYPSHKATVYIKETGDKDFRYYFEKAVITEQGDYEPFGWGV